MTGPGGRQRHILPFQHAACFPLPLPPAVSPGLPSLLQLRASSFRGNTAPLALLCGLLGERHSLRLHGLRQLGADRDAADAPGIAAAARASDGHRVVEARAEAVVPLRLHAHARPLAFFCSHNQILHVRDDGIRPHVRARLGRLGGPTLEHVDGPLAIDCRAGDVDGIVAPDDDPGDLIDRAAHLVGDLHLGARLQGARDARHDGTLGSLRIHGGGVRHALDGHDRISLKGAPKGGISPLENNRVFGPLDGGGGVRGGGHAGQAWEGTVLQVLKDRGVCA
mmetsp:Transcript_15775/g.31880  ORF Transcript_15775/g.31880 Transcript_15775/m.31880 type:complete len:280 (-) Transcript_15775:385-1224(-)